MKKQVCFIHNVSVHAVADVFADHPKFGLVLKGTVVLDQRQRFKKGESIRTSLLVSVNNEEQTFETLNTLYQVVPESQVDTFSMVVA